MLTPVMMFRYSRMGGAALRPFAYNALKQARYGLPRGPVNSTKIFDRQLNVDKAVDNWTNYRNKS
jgi:hypothetical protein